MCNRDKDPLPLGHMPLSRFKSIIDQNRRTLEFIWPFGEGEPLLNENIYEMVRYARDSGVRVELSTNATMLDESRSRKLLDCGVDNLILAFDGATAASYEKYRAGAKFDWVKRNIEAFLAFKLKSRARMKVILQMVLLRDNEHETSLFKKMWNRRGVDIIRFKEDQLKYSSIRADIYRPRKERKRLPCFLLWRGSIFIRHDGTVAPCCRFAGKPPLGDLRKSSFDQFWNSTEMQNIRKAHVSGDLSQYPPCQHCTIPRPNLLFTIISFLAGPLLISRLLPYVERLQLFKKIPVFQNSYGQR
jgi:radical SAM protein with 4Fe4S-binding SPASM domain